MGGQGPRRDIAMTGTGGDLRQGEMTTGGLPRGGMNTMMSGEGDTMVVGAGDEDEVASEEAEAEAIMMSSSMMTMVVVMDPTLGGKTRKTGSPIILSIFLAGIAVNIRLKV